MAGIFTASGIRKAFGATRVLNDVALDLSAGEVVVLMGANGAGKSTLVKIVSGVYSADAGQMELDGRPFAPSGPAEAIRAGIVTVHQNIDDGVVAALDVATNLTMDQLNRKGAPILFNRRRIRREAQAVADRLGLNLAMNASVSELSLADRQMVAIARAMAHSPKVMILDEPTSSLSATETERLFALIGRLRAQGVAILYISHRMSDIRRLADRIITLRDGLIAGRFETRPLDYEGAIEAMLGRKIEHATIETHASTAPVFEAKNLRLRPDSSAFDLQLGAGEVVAVTGLVGVGKTRLAETLFGVRAPSAGTMTLDGKDYAPSTPRQAIDLGVHTIGKDRAQTGIVGGFDVWRNISLPFLTRLSRFGVTRRGAERRLARDGIANLNIVCRSERSAMSTLSGGNQQKVMVARWLSHPCRLLILDEPFQGVDIAARRDIASKLRATAPGRATLIFLTEIDEAIEVADRILVMSEHTIVGEHLNRNLDMDRLLMEIAGQAPTGIAA